MAKTIHRYTTQAAHHARSFARIAAPSSATVEDDEANTSKTTATTPAGQVGGTNDDAVLAPEGADANGSTATATSVGKTAPTSEGEVRGAGP